MKNLISNSEYKDNRLSPIYSIGEGCNPNIKCNRKFYIQSTDTIIFKPNRNTKIDLNIKCNNKYKQYLNILMLHQDLKDIPITYKLSTGYIWISFDESVLKDLYKPYKPIKDRIISIDMNPNYIGYSIVDWKDSETFNIIDKGVISIKHLNDKFNQLKTTNSDSKKIYLNNKRLFETLQVSNFLIDKMKHYRCSIFAIEDLNIKSKDSDKGKRFNRLVNNQWNRNRLVNNLSKWCNIYNIDLIKVKSEYSSFIGNIRYRNLQLPDMILSSIEISRRGFEFYHQYMLKDINIKKNIIFLELSNKIKKLISQSLEELNINYCYSTLYDLYSYLKNCKCRYRVPLQLEESFSHKPLKYQLVL